MIGLDVFKKHFIEYEDAYTLIGGAACYLNFQEEGSRNFRATNDLDIVLCVEAITPEFIKHFWTFVNEGEYENRKKNTDEFQFYRFDSPKTPGYPKILELLSRKDGLLDDEEPGRITPMTVEEKIVSLSAMILDDEYYKFIMNSRTKIEGVVLVGPECLIPLKAKAWLNNRESKKLGKHVNDKDIRKHKNDVFILHELMTVKKLEGIPKSISDDIASFTKAMRKEIVDRKHLKLTFEKDEVLDNLNIIYGIPEDVE